MPRKSAILGLLLSLSLAAMPAAAQEQFFADSFGAKATAGLAHRDAPRTDPQSPPGALRPTGHPSEQQAGSLVRPAAFETPADRPWSVQMAGQQPLPEEQPVASPAAAGSSPDLASTGPAALAPMAKEFEASPASLESSGFPRLAPRNQASKQGGQSTVNSVAGANSIVTVISSLAVVLGLFCMAAWLMRRTAPRGHTALPHDVFEVLGRASIAKGRQVQLLRCGGRLLLVSVTPEGAETLTEIDDPDEVARLAALCKAAQPGSATAAFRQALQQFAGHPVQREPAGGTDVRVVRPGEPRLPREVGDFHG